VLSPTAQEPVKQADFPAYWPQQRGRSFLLPASAQLKSRSRRRPWTSNWV